MWEYSATLREAGLTPSLVSKNEKLVVWGLTGFCPLKSVVAGRVSMAFPCLRSDFFPPS